MWNTERLIAELQKLLAAGTAPDPPVAPVTLSATELSHSEVESALRAALAATAGGNGDSGPWIRDVYPSRVIYAVGYDGPLYQQDYTIDAATRAVTLANATAVRVATDYEPVTMSIDFAADPPVAAADAPPPGAGGSLLPAGWVERIGTLFRIGDYPDKKFSLSAAEADALVANFTPVPLEVEHVRSVFDGHLGRLTAVTRDGDLLKTTAHLPAWADAVWDSAGRKISASFHPTAKTLLRAGMVLNPYVSEAALDAAFSGARHNADDRATNQLMHDLTVRQGAACAAPAMAFTADPDKELPAMAKTLSEWLAEMPPGLRRDDVLAALDTPPVAFSAPSARETDLTARLAAVEARERRVAAEAEVRQWMLVDHLIVPAQFSLLVDALAGALADDAAHPVNFSADPATPRGRVDALRAGVRAGVPHHLTDEQIPATAAILFGNVTGGTTNTGTGGGEDPNVAASRKSAAEYAATLNAKTKNGAHA